MANDRQLEAKRQIKSKCPYKMTYLEWWSSILKMREDTRANCNLEKQHVGKEVGTSGYKWKEHFCKQSQLMTSWDESRKKTRRGISGGLILGPREGGKEGAQPRRARASPGRSLPPSPLFLSPLPFPPKGGPAPPLKSNFVKKLKLHLPSFIECCTRWISMDNLPPPNKQRHW